MAVGRPFVYIDHGYLKPGHFDGYYRVAWNALHTDLRHEPDFAKLGVLGISLEESPRGVATDPILVIEPSPYVGAFWDFEPRAWTARVIQQCQEHAPRRPVIVCTKESENLDKAFERAWAVVCYQSNLAVRAVQHGKPVFVPAGFAPVRGASPAKEFGNTDLAKLQTPILPDRRARQVWLAKLGVAQFRLDEMARGEAWAWLRANAPAGVATALE